MRAYWRLVMWVQERLHRRALRRALRTIARDPGVQASVDRFLGEVERGMREVALGDSEHAWSFTPDPPVWHWHIDTDGRTHVHVREGRQPGGDR